MPPARGGVRLLEMLTVGDQTDVNGRLLLEDSAPKMARKNAARLGVAMRTVNCPYKDTPSRYGARMNLSAYEALRRDTAEILNGFAWLGERYEHTAGARRATPEGLAKVAKLGVTLPLVLFHRADDPVPPYRALPSFVAAIFKAGRGIFSAAVDIINEMGPGTPLGAADAVRFAEDEGHLVRRQTGRACAAPTRLIERTIDAALTSHGADPARSTLGDSLDFDTLWEFCTLDDSFSEACSAYKFILDNFVKGVTSRSYISGDLFDQVVPHDGNRRSLGDVTEELLQRANAVQSNLNRLLGRADDAPPLTVQELFKIL